MRDVMGVIAAMLSSGLGGTAVGATRYVIDATDPLTLGALRLGLGFVFLTPVAALHGGSWPPRSDWPRVAGLGVLFFGAFPVLFNASLAYTTAARGALSLSTLPLLTMVVAAALRVEPLSGRKTVGVIVAMLGVSAALLTGLATSPPGSWRGDLLMVAAALCMALYSVWSKPVIRRSGPIRFTTAAMFAGAAFLTAAAALRGDPEALLALGAQQWVAIGYLGVVGSALTFFLWAFALGHTTPTRVAVSVTVNPVTASLVGATMLDEPIRWNTLLGLAMVLLGILIAATNDKGTPAAT